MIKKESRNVARLARHTRVTNKVKGTVHFCIAVRRCCIKN